MQAAEKTRTGDANLRANRLSVGADSAKARRREAGREVQREEEFVSDANIRQKFILIFFGSCFAPSRLRDWNSSYLRMEPLGPKYVDVTTAAAGLIRAGPAG